MSPSASASPLRQILETRISQLSTEVEGLFAEARERGRRESADQLNQAVRRIRQSADLEELGATLLDAASGFSTGAALFHIRGDEATGERIRGVPASSAESFEGIEISLASAAALAGAVETRDPVTAIASAAEVSAEIVGLLDHKPDGRVSIFPLVVRDRVPVLLYTWGAVQISALELLSQVAAAVWTELSRPSAPDLVQIAAAVVAPSQSTAAGSGQPATSAWEQLSAEEQQLHFRAQRFARVQAAEIRLHEPDAVKSGRAHGDLYRPLRKSIDAAREKFRKSYFMACGSMVDYLHLELVRTLANDNPELLGKEYPGPLA